MSLLNWEKARVVDRENHQRLRHVNEAIWVRRTPEVMHRV